MDTIQCPVCGSQSKLKFKLKFNVYKCAQCGLYTSDADFDFSFQSSLELDNREIGLKQLRFENFETIVKALKDLKGRAINNIKGLEIGSGNGWWLKVCRENGIDCIGIEPENVHQDYHRANGLDVYYGFYPDRNVKRKQGYDFIIFNDVFEHIRDLSQLIISLKEDLNDKGMLIINLPMSDGFFYRTGALLYKLGIRSFLERLWQFNFHSPHINYFNEKNLEILLNEHGFLKQVDFKLNTLDFSTIKERIKADKGISKLKAIALTGGLRLIKPVILASKPDIRVFFFIKNQL